MSAVIELVRMLIRFILRQKWKILLLVWFTFVFLIVLFPFGDLGDFVSTQVSALTNNSVFLNFDRMKMSAWPAPGFQFQEVYVEAANTPPLSAKELVISPSLRGLFYQRPYGKVTARGLLKGNVEVSIGPGKRSEKGTERQKIDLDVEKISLEEVRTLANLPVILKGQINLDSKILADLSLSEQPEINDLNLSISNFELPPSTIDMNGIPFSLPSLKLSKVELKGRLSDGRFYIESGSIGQDKDEMTGSVKGSMDLHFDLVNGLPMQQLGAYEFQVDLKMKKAFQDKAGLMLNILGDLCKCNHPIPGGVQFKVKLAGLRFGLQPQMTPLR